MRPIDYALNYISLRIPKEILEIGLINNDNTDDLTTLNDKLVRNVINKYVRPDLDMNGGSLLHINIDQCQVTPVNNQIEFLIRVPKHLTDDLSIIRPLNLSSRMLYSDQTQIYSGTRATSMLNIASKMINAVDDQPRLTTTNLELIGDNLIRCREPIGMRMYQHLQVIVENKENFSNIQPQYFDKFAEMCLACTKMAIYTNSVISLNEGYIKGGHEISVIKEIIDSYHDEFERYEELKTVWRKISVLNDQHRMHKLIKITCGGHI